MKISCQFIQQVDAVALINGGATLLFFPYHERCILFRCGRRTKNRQWIQIMLQNRKLEDFPPLHFYYIAVTTIILMRDVFRNRDEYIRKVVEETLVMFYRYGTMYSYQERRRETFLPKIMRGNFKRSVLNGLDPICSLFIQSRIKFRRLSCIHNAAMNTVLF